MLETPSIDQKKFRLFFWLGFLFLLLLAIGLVFNSEIVTTRFGDTTYHLLTAQGFARADGITLQSTWESLPDGRAQLYPPLYHVLLAGLVKLNLAPLTIITIAAVGAVLSLLTIAWWALGQLFGWRQAFIFLVLLTVSEALINMLAITTPASIVLMTSPLLLLLIDRKKTAAAATLMTLLFYTHMMFPWLVVGALIIWVIFNRAHTKRVVTALGVSFLLYLPWLVHILKNKLFLRYTYSTWPDTFRETIVWDFEANLVVLFALAVLFIALRYFQLQKQRLILFFCALFALATPLLFIAPLRFFSSAGGLMMVIITAFFFDSLFTIEWKNIGLRRMWPALVWIGLITSISFGYRIVFDVQTKVSQTLIEDNVIVKIIKLARFGEAYPGMLLPYAYTPSNLALAETIAQHSKPDEPIYNLALFFNLERYHPRIQYIPAQLFGALSNRPIANLRYPENEVLEPVNLVQVPIVLADYRQTHLFANPDNVELADVLATDFEVLGESDRLVAFKNIRPDTIVIHHPRRIIPLWIVWLLIALACIYIGLTSFKLSRKKITP